MFTTRTWATELGVTPANRGVLPEPLSDTHSGEPGAWSVPGVAARPHAVSRARAVSRTPPGLSHPSVTWPKSARPHPPTEDPAPKVGNRDRLDTAADQRHRYRDGARARRGRSGGCFARRCRAVGRIPHRVPAFCGGGGSMRTKSRAVQSWEFCAHELVGDRWSASWGPADPCFTSH